jgi:uncharacterized membrane protein YphA (DoxX/SURF4 family)
MTQPESASGPGPDAKAARLPGTILQGILARAALVVLRIYLGITLVLGAWGRLQIGVTPPAHTSILAYLISWGELLAGAFLLVGLLTRLWAAAALILALLTFYAEGAWQWSPSSHAAAVSAIALALLIGAAGRTLGLDAALARRWPRSPFW